MRLLCINTTGWEVTKSYLWGLIKYEKNSTGPTYGDTVSVVYSCWSDGTLYYYLTEWPKKGDCFEAAGFIPLSTIDETEMQREYKTQKQTI